MYVLGINCVYHESAACLLENGRVVAAVEEERFNRIKHAKTPQLDNPDHLPLQAMNYCLEQAGIDLRHIDHIGYSSNPDAQENSGFFYDALQMQMFADNIRAVLHNLRIMGFTGELHFLDHHTTHAASAFFPSPFEQAAVLTVDGIGDGNTTAGYAGCGHRLTPVYDVPAPHSIGFLWELTSMFLGFGIYDATKIMGLSAYGDPARYEHAIRALIRARPKGQFRVAADELRFWELDYNRQTGHFEGLKRTFGLPNRHPEETLKQEHYDIAAALQRVTDDILLHVIRHLHEETQSPNLCLAGGVALNCVSNQRVFEEGPFERLFVQPAAHDAGTAVGAALSVWHDQLGNSSREPMLHAYLGPQYTAAQMEQAIARRGLTYRHCDNVERDVAERLSRGDIVGVLQGRMEIGPRALGNRSLLADPRNPRMRDVLNDKVKHREFFRPFAPSVLHEEARRWFHIGKDCTADEFMLMAYPVREEMRDRIPAVVHADGTSRIQTVRQDVNPRYHRFISEFQSLTGVPIVLNTSFNDSEPIVCSPDDALDTFLKTRIDHLAMGDFLVSKADNPDRMAGALNMPSRSTSDGPLVVTAFRRSGDPLTRVTTVSQTARESPQRVHPALRPTATAQRTFPELQLRLEHLLGQHRISRLGDCDILSDRADATQPDAVLPLFHAHRFFLDEMPREAFRDARILDVETANGVLALSAVNVGAGHVVAVDSNPRAQLLAGFNILLNGFESAIELRSTHRDDLYHAVREERFDGIVSNPPFLPAATPPHNDGLQAVEQILRGLDDHLTPDGFAQIMTPAPGDTTGPTVFTKLIQRHLSGQATVRFLPQSERFSDLIYALMHIGRIEAPAAKTIIRRAKTDGVSRCYLCVLHYRRRGNAGVTVAPAQGGYENWHHMLPGVQWPQRDTVRPPCVE